MNKLLLLVVILQKISLASVCSQKNFGMGEMGETFLLLMVVATQKRFSINLGPAVNILKIVRDKIEFKYHFKILYFKWKTVLVDAKVRGNVTKNFELV